MKNLNGAHATRFLSALFCLLLALGLLAGCSPAASQPLSTAAPSAPASTQPSPSASQPAPAPASAAQGTVTLQDAQEEALRHAGVPANEATFTKAKLDTDDGVQEYDIEFVANGIFYEYEIGAAGNVVGTSHRNVLVNVPTETQAYIPVEDAQDAAVAHAGVPLADAVFTKIEFGTDDGIDEYEIDFVAGDTKHECTVNAQTGVVTEYEAENI